MRFLINFVFILSTLLYSPFGAAQFKPVEKGDISLVNLLDNGGAERGKSGWAITTDTYSVTTTAANVSSGSAAFSWDSAGAARVFKTNATATPVGLISKTGAASCNIQVPSGTATHTMDVYNSTTSTILNSVTVTSSTTYARTTVNFPFPSTTDNIQIRFSSVAANEPQIYIDDCILADAQFVNIFIVDTSITPTATVLSSSSGTYTVPSGAAYLVVEVVGGGGGGGAGGNGATAGYSGDSSLFKTAGGSTILSASGGTYGAQSGNSAGGGWSYNSPAILIQGITGAGGGGAGYQNAAAQYTAGGMGGATPLGGAGAGGAYSTNGQAAYAGSGSGGGGGSTTVTGGYVGGGGAASGYVKAIIPGPLAATYTYTVAQVDADANHYSKRGLVGTNGTDAGNGGAGSISITVYYTPLKGLAANLSNSLDSMGSVFYVPGATCPTGSLKADGTAVSRTTYAPLFARYGTAAPFGVGDGSTTFNLPNLSGLFIRTTGTQTISSVAQTAGTIGVGVNDQTQGHYHNFSGSVSGGSSTSSIYQKGNAGDYNSTAVNQMATDGTNGTPRTGTTTYPANMAMTACISFATAQMPFIVGASPNYTAKTTAYTATIGDYVDATSGTFTVTLPSAVGFAGKSINVKNSGTGVITVATTSSQTIDGITSKILSTQYQNLNVTSDGANWKTYSDLGSFVSKSGSYTATHADGTIIFTATATLTLPAAASNAGRKYNVIASGASTNVTIDPNASETVCGATTILLAGAPDSIEIQSDGTNWQALNGGCYVTHTFRAGTTNQTTVCSASPCSSLVSDGSWASSVSRASAGVYTVNILSGVFSVAPVCSALSGNPGASRTYMNGNDYPTTTSFPFSTITDAGTQADSVIYGTCRGPR